jgi:enoyl-CoA hydratase/carnithine racemase
MKMILQSRRIGAEEASRVGLVTQLLDAAEAELFIGELAASVAAMSKAVVKQIKQSVQQGNSRSFSTGDRPEQGGTFVI